MSDDVRDKIRKRLPGVQLGIESGMCHAHLQLGTTTRDVYAPSWAELERKLVPPSTGYGEKSDC